MHRSLLTLLAATVAMPAFADGHLSGELNLYSSRHYDTDERLYSDFEEMTGVTINRIEGNADELIARMEAEGANSPADVLLTVDTTRLERAKAAGVLQPVSSDVLEERIPGNLQDADNEWFGFSKRARIFFYDEAEVSDPPQTYLDLADPAYEGMVCHRSSTNVYSQTLLSAMIEHHGEDVATEWAQGLVNNFARDPQGGDTDQLRGLVSGECDIAISNTYYFARALRTEVDGLGASELEGIGWVFPSMAEGEGSHINLSGGGVAANAPNRDNAVAFLEYLASDQAQSYFANGNDEYPAVAGVPLSDSVAALGEPSEDMIDLSAVAQNVAAANRIFAEVGWE
jgi:iron(III) transport system substrate-binding protein